MPNKQKQSDRNAEIIDRIKSGESLGDIAVRFNLTIAYVRLIGRMNGVILRRSIPPHRHMQDTAYRVIALIQQGATQSSAARHIGVSHQRVQQIVAKCREFGVTLARRDE